MADRFYCPDPPRDGRVVLEGDEARHLAGVLRAAVGDRVEVFDGRGNRFGAEVAEVGKGRVFLRISEGPIEEEVARVHFTLATAVPKGDRFDWLVEKATEIGVETLIPLATGRSVVDPGASKLERLRRRVVEASKQSGRDRLMELTATRSLPEILSDRSWETRWIAHPGGGAIPFETMGDRVAVAIGPEGGFTDEEIELARGSGWSVVGLGPRRLRVETAALVASAMVLARGGMS